MSNLPFDDHEWMNAHEAFEVAASAEANEMPLHPLIHRYIALNKRLYEELIRTRQALNAARDALSTPPLPFFEPQTITHKIERYAQE